MATQDSANASSPSVFFAISWQWKMDNVVMLPVNPPTLQPAPVSGGSGSPSRNFEGEYPIYVPAESVSSYKNAAGWYYYASRIHSIEEMYPHTQLCIL